MLNNIQIFNGTQEEIENRQHDIFIGISMGAFKPIDMELAKKYVRWALKHTKENVIILIADEIAKFNYKVFSHYGNQKSLNRALREGSSYMAFFNEVLNDFTEEDRNKIKLVWWLDIVTERYVKLKAVLDEEFRKNPEFREKIKFFIRKYVERRGNNLSDEELIYLSEYILCELPTLLDGITFKGINARLILYPTFVHSGMSKFIVAIQKGDVFPHLREKLSLKNKTIMVEAYLNKEQSSL